MISWISFDIKFALSVLASLVMIGAYIPYFRDIFQRKTKPHAYTWLIWTITMGTATAGLWYGGGGWGTLSMLVVTILVLAVFLLSLKFGTRNITRSDTVVLIAALLAILVWWKLSSPLLAVIMVSVIDGLGYIPSFRKTFEEPWTETPSSWAIFAVSNALTIISLGEYNFLTLIYMVTTIVANISIFSLCLLRRKFVSRP